MDQLLMCFPKLIPFVMCFYDCLVKQKWSHL